MRKVDPSEMDARLGPAAVSRPLSDALGTTDLAVNYYELDPGESTAYGLHAHDDQEEVFYVLSGRLRFETDGDPVHAEAGELVRVGRGEYQRSHNDGDERATVLAMGAPRDGGDTEVLRSCADCGRRTPQDLGMTEDRSAVQARCTVCGSVTGEFD